MASAAPDLVAASKSANGIDSGKLTEMANAITPVMNIISAIKADGNVDTSAYADDVMIIGDYARLLTEIGTAFSSFDGIQNVKAADILEITNIIDALKTVSSQLEELQTYGGEVADEDNPFLNLGIYVRTLNEIGSDMSGVTAVVGALTELGTVDLTSGDPFNEGTVTNVTTNIKSLSDMINDLSSIDTSGVDKFTDALGKINNADLDNAEQNLSKAKESASATGAAMGKSITSGIDSNEIGSGISSALTTALSGVSVSGFTSLGAKLGGDIASGIMQSSRTISHIIGTVCTSAKTKAEGYKKDFEAAGRAFDSGLANGINAAKSLAITAAATVAAQALNAAKQKLDIQSPSKEAAKVGMFFDMGFANGLRKYSSSVYDESAAVASLAMQGIKRAAEKASDIFNEEGLGQPVISPVLDLSNIQSGASEIGSLLSSSNSLLLGNFGAISENADALRQKAETSDILDALNALGSGLEASSGDTYNVNGVTYDDGSNVSDAVRQLIRAAKIERRA